MLASRPRPALLVGRRSPPFAALRQSPASAAGHLASRVSACPWLQEQVCRDAVRAVASCVLMVLPSVVMGERAFRIVREAALAALMEAVELLFSAHFCFGDCNLAGVSRFKLACLRSARPGGAHPPAASHPGCRACRLQSLQKLRPVRSGPSPAIAAAARYSRASHVDGACKSQRLRLARRLVASACRPWVSTEWESRSSIWRRSRDFRRRRLSRSAVISLPSPRPVCATASAKEASSNSLK